MDLITLGKIIDTHGLEGEVKVYSSTQFPNKRYVKGNKLFLISPNGTIKIEVTVNKHSNKGIIDFVSFDEINDQLTAMNYKGYFIKINKEKAILPKDHYFYSDLEKCEVYSKENILLGKVKNVEEFPAQVTLRVLKEDGTTFFVPFLNEFIKDVDIENKKIVINVIDGML